MRENIKKLKEERASVWEQTKAVLDEAREHGFDAERQAKHAELDATLERLSAQIDAEEKLYNTQRASGEFAEQRAEETGVTVERYDEVFRKWCAEGTLAMEADERAILRGHNVQFENRAQQVATGAAGGFTVPESFWNRVSETLKAYGGVEGVANVISTDTGATLPWPTNDGTANKGAILGEGTQITEQDETFGVRNIDAYMYTSNLIRVSYQLLQDSAIDVEGFLARKMAERLARIRNEHFTTGTGTAQPDGIVTGATAGVTTASGTAITGDEIIDLVHSVDPAYRGNGRFMFSDGVLQYLRKLKDSNGQYLWQPSVQVGEPNTLFGYGYTVNQDMASSVAVNNTTALFGDFNEGYVIRNVRGLQVVRLDERYADYLQVGWFAFLRCDGTKDNTGAYKALVQAAA